MKDANYIPSSGKCGYKRYRGNRRKYHHVGAFIQRLVVGAAVSMTSAVLLAEMMGVWR